MNLMSNITLTACNPIEIISSSIQTKDKNLHSKFMQQIKHLYQYSMFKPILDLTATKIQQGLLHFKLHDARFFDLDAGNCRTIVNTSSVSGISGLFQKMFIRKKYCITIKKISAEVIIHEIAHMVEQELNESLDISSFINAFKKDIQKSHSTNPSLRQAINHIFIQQVAHYPPEQQNSEIFARFFQIFAAAKEVAFAKSEGYSYDFYQVSSCFEISGCHFNQCFMPSLRGILNEEIVQASSLYIKNLDEISNPWSDRRIQSKHSIHHNNDINNSKPQPKWGKTIKSIKDNPFQ